MNERIGNFSLYCWACGAKIEGLEEAESYTSDAMEFMCSQCINITNNSSDLCLTSIQRFLKGNVI